MQRLFNYFKDSRAELARVTWPTRRQAVRLTLVVIAFSVVLALFIGGIDYLFSRGLQLLIRKA